MPSVLMEANSGSCANVNSEIPLQEPDKPTRAKEHVRVSFISYGSPWCERPNLLG